MAIIAHPIETALRSGSRAKNFAKKIVELCHDLPVNPRDLTDEQRDAILRLAALCRATRAAANILSLESLPGADTASDFFDLFNETYFPVMEDGKRTVGFWSIKDRATLTPDDVHEWVRDTKIDKKTGKSVATVVSFGNWWKQHQPDYELYGVASDRSAWREKLIVAEGGRKCVNALYGCPPVLMDEPEWYGDGKDANQILDAILERTITDEIPTNAERKRRAFVVDAGSHLLALRDGGSFQCRKLFAFTSTNQGQGSGKSLLHESLAALVPRDATCTVPTTYLAGDNLLPLYGSSVCILTEAPSNANERYTAEDIKAFADAGWKTAQEKYVAKRPVRDTSLKLLSSNHLSPLPIDSPVSRRIEFFVSVDADDGGASLRAMLDQIQARTRWTPEQMRICIGWAFLLRAKRLTDEGAVPFAVARRTIDPKHLLSMFDYEYFVLEDGRRTMSYSAYRDARTDKGFTWTVDAYRYRSLFDMSQGGEKWLDDPLPDAPPPGPPMPEECASDEALPVPDEVPEESADEEEPRAVEVGRLPVMQFKPRTATARLCEDLLTIPALYSYIVTDQSLREMTAAVRAGSADKREVLRQVFPGAVFSKFTRNKTLLSYTGLTHVDFDKISENGNGLTAAEVRDGLAQMRGFVIGGVSSRGNGAWAIFNAGPRVVDLQTYIAAEQSLFALVEERFGMRCDHGLRLPTVGRTLAHDPDCQISPDAVCGRLPDPYEWKAPTFKVSSASLQVGSYRAGTTIDQQVLNEKFLEKVVESACERIQIAMSGERHDTAIRSIANIALNCRERGMTPHAAWGRRVRDACASVGLDSGETNSIMAYWRQMTGLSA